MLRHSRRIERVTKIAHFPGTAKDQAEVLTALEHEIDAGKVRFFIALAVQKDGELYIYKAGNRSALEEMGLLGWAMNCLE